MTRTDSTVVYVDEIRRPLSDRIRGLDIGFAASIFGSMILAALVCAL